MIPKLTEAIAQSDGEVKSLNLGSMILPTPSKELYQRQYLQFEITGSPDTPGKIKEKLRLEKRLIAY